MKTNEMVRKIVNHYLASIGRQNQKQEPLFEVLQFRTQRRRCVMWFKICGAIFLLVVVAAFVGDNYIGGFRLDSYIKYTLIANAIAFPYFMFRYAWKMIQEGRIASENETVSDLLEAFDDFEKAFGKSPEKLGPQRASQIMVKTARKKLRLEARKKHSFHMYGRLCRQFNSTRLLMPVPLGAFNEIFRQARQKEPTDIILPPFRWC